MLLFGIRFLLFGVLRITISLHLDLQTPVLHFARTTHLAGFARLPLGAWRHDFGTGVSPVCQIVVHARDKGRVRKLIRRRIGNKPRRLVRLEDRVFRRDHQIVNPRYFRLGTATLVSGSVLGVDILVGRLLLGLDKGSGFVANWATFGEGLRCRLFLDFQFYFRTFFFEDSDVLFELIQLHLLFIHIQKLVWVANNIDRLKVFRLGNRNVLSGCRTIRESISIAHFVEYILHFHSVFDLRGPLFVTG